MITFPSSPNLIWPYFVLYLRKLCKAVIHHSVSWLYIISGQLIGFYIENIWSGNLLQFKKMQNCGLHMFHKLHVYTLHYIMILGWIEATSIYGYLIPVICYSISETFNDLVFIHSLHELRYILLYRRPKTTL